MGNCSFFKSKGVITGNNRPINAFDLYAVKLNNPSDIQLKFQFGFSATTTISIVGDGRVAETIAGLDNPSATSITFSGQKDLYFSNGNYIIRISDRNNLTRLRVSDSDYKNIVNTKTSDLLACENLSYINMNMISGDVVSLPQSLVSIALFSNLVTGNLSAFTNSQIVQLFLNSSEIKGTISDILGLTAMSNLSFGDSPNISGALDDLLDIIAATGTSRTISFTGNGVVTIQGVAVGNQRSKSITFSGGSWTVN